LAEDLRFLRTPAEGTLDQQPPQARVIEGAQHEGRPRYWLTRFLILRLLGLVYLVAFLGLAFQARPLIGHHGLLPADLYLERVADHFGTRTDGFLQVPSLFWIGISDTALTALAWTGVGLSLLLLAGFANGLHLIVLWALYMSFLHIGQDWYGYGWEIQLLETGFLSIFFVPLLDPRPFPKRPPPVALIWLYRWLIFRIMLGAALIKLRGDPCWRDLTCLYYHYETQPIPNPLSRYIHFMPHWFHKGGVLYNYLAELVAPWWIWGDGIPAAMRWTGETASAVARGSRLVRHAAGGIMLLLQVTLILSGNLSFLNYLTIVPILACFDDSLLRRVLPKRLVARADRAAAEGVASPVQRAAAILLVALVAYLSIAPVQNLISREQAMNTSFDRLDLVNTYGAFGSVGEERYQLVFEGTSDAVLTDATVWKEYPYKYQPGDVMRRPPVVAPYQPRLDWAVWFAAMSSYERYPWTLHVLWKLLHNDPGMLSLMGGNPFRGAPPRFVRARIYRYAFAPIGNPEGAWWRREFLREWLPPLSADNPQLREFLRREGWISEGETPPEGGP
jgi:hypothetical protein